MSAGDPTTDVGWDVGWHTVIKPRLLALAAAEEQRPRFWLMTNHWGWSLHGILGWLREWAWVPRSWGSELCRPVFMRYRKFGPICWRAGVYLREDNL